MTAPTAPTPTVDDAWAEADQAKWNPTFTVYGEVDVNVAYVVLQKGIGKVPFDPQQHQLGGRCVSVEITIIPVIPGREPVRRNMLAQSREWTQIVNPSIKALGPNWNAQQLKGRYVEVQLVKSGRKFRNAEGEEREATTVKFLRVFGSEDECAAAAVNRFGAEANGAAAATAVPPDVTAANTDPERATAAKFLAPLWKSCGGDVGQFEALLKANPLTARYFDLSSPEVNTVIGGAAETLPF